MLWHYSREGKNGVRAWWNFGSQQRRCLKVEFYWWSPRCNASVSVDDEGWSWALALPPFALYLGFDGFPAWKPMRLCVATWDNNREFMLTDQREASVSVHDWTIRMTPWGRSMEWAAKDPWWVRGVSLNLTDVVLGKSRYVCEQIGQSFPVSIPMPEGDYPAVFQRQRQTWKRPRWFAHTRESFDITIPKGIPFAGKGENAYDCDDDGLYGMGAEGTVEDAVAAVRATVLRSRKRYGAPSPASIQSALA